MNCDLKYEEQRDRDALLKRSRQWVTVDSDSDSDSDDNANVISENNIDRDDVGYI